MKNSFNKFINVLMAILFLSMFMLIVGALTSCSPKFVLPAPDSTLPEWVLVDDPTEVTRPDYDTIQWVKVLQLDGDVITISLDSLMNSDKVVIDTIWVAGDEVVVFDSIPCPEGLRYDSFVTFKIIKELPPRMIPVSVTVLDTVWLTKPCPTVTSAQMIANESGWPERIAWFLGVAALLVGYWRQWRNSKSKASTTA